ncbi:MAG: hypothetical protein LBS20_16900 [Prevotella sp.]|jgi:hypothetical protein|nr:hypothetical protein [Prevotella sp.]
MIVATTIKGFIEAYIVQIIPEGSQMDEMQIIVPVTHKPIRNVSKKE